MSETRLWPSGGQIAWANGKWTVGSRSESVDAIERLASELDIDVDTVAETAPRMARTHTDRSSAVAAIQRLAGLPTLSERPSDSVRVVDEDTARHEAAHCVASYQMGWLPTVCDAQLGQTRAIPPDYDWQSLTDRWTQEAVIAAAAAGFTGSYRDQPFEDDRYQVRARGLVDWKTARAKAAELAADRKVKAMYNRLVAALIMVGRLEGDALLSVLEGEP